MLQPPGHDAAEVSVHATQGEAEPTLTTDGIRRAKAAVVMARLPTDELLLGDYKEELEVFAATVGRPDRSLTVDEYIRFLEHRGERHNPVQVREWFGEVAAMFATYPTGREGSRRALLAHMTELLETLEARP